MPLNTQGYNDTQVMITLCAISYLGCGVQGTSSRDAKRVCRALKIGLNLIAPVKGDWEIVWGPAMFRFPATTYDDNMMFVVRHLHQKGTYAIVVRGTNPTSLSNWLLEDFAVERLVPWRYGKPHPQLDAGISLGTAIGLTALQNMRATASVPGSGLDLVEFLIGELLKNRSNHINLYITGHSLGGTLTPAMAMWLHDIRKPIHGEGSWDEDDRVRIHAYPVAGLTPGNAGFAKYFDKHFAPSATNCCERIWNYLDVAPHCWDETLMADLPTLYEPYGIEPLPWEKIAIDAATKAGKGMGYKHVVPNAKPMEGSSGTNVHQAYLGEAIYQHSAAYLKLAGLAEQVDLDAILNGEILTHADFAF